MTRYQAEILYIIVQVAKKEGWRIPTGERLARLLHEHGIRHLAEKEATASARTANDHVQRLHESQKCFRKQGQMWYVNPEKLCTEPETALYFLVADQMAVADRDGRIAKQRLHTVLESKLGLDPQAFAVIFAFGCDMGYLEVFPTTPAFVRAGHRTKEQRHYLKLLLTPPNLELLLNETNESGSHATMEGSRTVESGL